MIEIVIKDIKYIDDIELNEQTAERLMVQLHKGSIIGLIVTPTQNPEKEALIEVVLNKEEQKTFIQKGLVISVEQKKEHYIIPRDWEEYHLIQTNGRLSGAEITEKMEYKPLTFQNTIHAQSSSI